MRYVLVAATCAAAGCGQLLGVDQLHDRSLDAGDAAPETCAPTLGVCNTFPQCGCLANENCEITTPYGMTTCSSAGVGALWANCSGFGSCPTGSTCIAGVCKPFCSAAADCIGKNVTCEQIKDEATNQVVPGLKVCSSGCDPLNPAAICGPNVACYPYPWDGLGHDHGDCTGPAGTAVGLDACTGSNATSPCAPGYYCTLFHDCMHWCRVGHNEDCSNGQTCLFFTVPAVISGVEYGVCKETD